jgi:hypothetical protein
MIDWIKELARQGRASSGRLAEQGGLLREP